MYSAFFPFGGLYEKIWNIGVVDSNNPQVEPLEETEGLNIADSIGCHKSSKTEENKCKVKRRRCCLSLS